MSARCVLATSNPGKLREIRAILAGLPITIEAVGPEVLDQLPDEGDDYARNASAKARAAARASGLPALADDSGLEVEALDGAPGPRSARYGGPTLDDAGRNARLLRALRGVPGARRGARFVCIAALATPEGEEATAFGECAGRILEAPRGGDGFGYDPVFLVVERDASMAELPAEVKNAISHRARAFQALAPQLLARVARGG